MAGKKILVIEDNELNLKLVRTLLELADFTVLEASDAEQGIALARNELPDIILMDIQLPRLDGLTATTIIKKDPLIGGIPVIAVTSFAMESDEKKALEAGCAGYISKPIDTRSFVNDVLFFLKESR
ncbi:MAG: response regulator [Deltaproteobacteria bacterium]|nr:response regulator [Deltaproteobacteria bacterium]